MTAAERTLVLVVGGGPVGLTAALALAAEAVPVVVLESGVDEVRSEWRGSTLHPPTLERLDTIGLAAPAVADGVRVDRLQYRDVELAVVAEFGYDALRGQTRYPFRVQYEQYKLLRRLRAAAVAHPGIDVRFGHTVRAVEVDDTRAAVTIVDGDGHTTGIQAEWVIGADGAHSVVRKAADIAFPGDTYPTLSLVAATRFELGQVIDDLGPVSYWTGPAGRVSLIRTPDTWRVALTTGITDKADRPDVSIERPYPGLVDALDRLVGDRRWHDVPLGQHELYRSHQRVADRFVHGRAVLVGDAAHLTSTTGGMGLNSGIHDAFALARQLAPPLRRGAVDQTVAAVAGYAERRRQAAVRIVQPATRAARLAADTTDVAARTARLDALRHSAADPVLAQQHLRDVSMFDAVAEASA